MGGPLSSYFSDTYKVKLENNIEMLIKPKFYRGDMLMLCLTEEKLTRMTFFSKDWTITDHKLNSPWK